jgi:Sugar-transfer associated ATP-grasp
MSLLTRVTESYGGLRQVLADPRRKALGRIVREAADVARRTGAYPEWYFLNFAYRRDAGDHTAYLHRGQYRRLMREMRRRENFAVLEDKLRFRERLRGTSVRLPRLLAHNEGATFRVGEEGRHVGDGHAFAALVGGLLARSAAGSVFAKPVEGRKGYGCRRVDGATAAAELAALHAETVAQRFLFEETLVQHPALAAIFPGSVNTVRVLTCGEPSAPPAAIAAILRLGVGRHAVDNASQGGIFVGVDLATGRLFPQARRFFKHGGDVHAAHPDTGFRFEGTEVPRYAEVLAAAEGAAAHVPHDLIGWDVAVTEAGPVVIEGNALPHLPMMEIGLGRGLMAHPSFRRLCERVAAAA